MTRLRTENAHAMSTPAIRCATLHLFTNTLAYKTNILQNPRERVILLNQRRTYGSERIVKHFTILPFSVSVVSQCCAILSLVQCHNERLSGRATEI